MLYDATVFVGLVNLLWPPSTLAIIFCHYGLFFLSSFSSSLFSSPILSDRKLDVYHTSANHVALV